MMKTRVLGAPMAFSNASVSTCGKGFWMDVLFGSYLLPPNLTGDAYVNFLQYILHGLLEDVPLRVRQKCGFSTMAQNLILLVRYEVI